MVKEYFSLLLKIAVRWLRNFGLAPWFSFVLLIGAFLGFSILLFQRVPVQAPFIYVGLAILLVAQMSDKARTDFLKITFKQKFYFRIRILENVAFSIPFACLLGFEGHLLPAILLLLASCILAFFRFKSRFNFTIPTPFGKHPFEFTVGFRTTFYLFFAALGLIALAVIAANFNLGLFAFAALFFVLFSYHTTPENEFYVWIFNTSPREFLWKKIKTTLIFGSTILLPFYGLILEFYPEKWELLSLVFVVGLCFLMVTILAKYAVFPNEINITEVIFLLVGLFVPPLLIFFGFIYYKKAIKNLQHYLA